jgi:ribosome-associated protein
MKIDDYERVLEDLKRRRIPAAVKKVVSVMLDKKAERVVVLKLKGISDITDYMIICHGNSSRQNNAVSDDIQKQLRKQLKMKAFGVEGEREAEWILIDYVDFVVHVFSKDNRKKYSIEKLWMDAKRYDFYSESAESVGGAN